MRNTAIYTELHKAHTTRMVRVGDTTQQLYAQQSIGEITGQYRTLPTIVSTGAQLDDAWQIVNLYIKQGNTDRYSDSCNSINSRYVGSVAVLGALDSAQAEAWALRQFSLETGATGACQACTTSAQALKLLLDHPASADELEIHSRIIEKFENRVTLTDVVWQGALLKTPERSTDLIHQMQILDRDGQLLDAMVPADMSVLLTELGATEAEYDALIVEYGTGDGSGINLLMNRLNAAMNKASVGKVKPVNVTLTKPFKRNSVTNVAVLFEFDDGQSVTIVFHNPDSTPGKLASGDILTSWKIMLNKRDVTAALSPPEGENVQLPDLAKRILLVVEKNSARFQRANTKKAEDVAALEAAQGRVDEKKQKLTGLLAEIEGLEKALDTPAPPVDLNSNVPSDDYRKNWQTDRNAAVAIAKTFGIETKGMRLPNLSERIKDAFAAQIFSAMLKKYQQDAAKLPEGLSFKPKTFEEKAFSTTLSVMLMGQGFRVELRSVFNQDSSDGRLGYIQNYIFFYDQKIKDFDLPKGDLLSVTQPEMIAHPAVDQIFQYLQEVQSVIQQQSSTTQSSQAEPDMTTSPDAQFFQSIIDGSVDALTVDMDHVIELGEKYPDDASMMDLLEKALEVINQAEQAAAQSVA